MKLWLVGMMGSGKTTVGRLLAKRLGWPFFDADEEIERAEARTIARIFEESGEPRFREIERDVVAKIAREDGDAVVALGGGAVLDGETRRLLRETGRTAVLDASPDVLAARVRGEDRPLLRGLDDAARVFRIAEIWGLRKRLYLDVADIIRNNYDEADVEENVRFLATWARSARAVRVELGPRSYDVLVEEGGKERLGCILRRAGLGSGPCALVIDEGVRQTFTLSRSQTAIVRVRAGEAAKRFAEVERLLDAFAEARLERGSPVVAVGGGATTDVAGFAAAIYLRGVPWVAVPTTLLGMVDAAIGGKTAVNLTAGKNLAGAFHQPRLVLVDPTFLRTLPARELASGMGEVAKYALIGPADLFAAVEEHLAKGGIPSSDLIARCIAVKAAVVAEDERETGGRRKVLNFGHTIGHAIEAAAGFGAVAHGEAVLLGMRAAVFLSRRRGILGDAEAAPISGLLARVPVRFPTDLPDEALLDFMLRDKKVSGAKLLFVLLRARGEPVVDVEVSREDVLAALAFLREEKP